MISVSGYFYDVEGRTKLDSKNVTIASTSILSPSDEHLIGIQIDVTQASTFDDYATVSHITSSQKGNINPSYNLFIELLGIPIPVIGTINSSNFVYDENNILKWFKLYYDAIKRRTDAAGENPHTIRFCRSEDFDIYYIEYNPFLYGDSILLKTDNNIRAIDYIFEGGYLYLYSNNVSGIKDYENFYLGCVSFNPTGSVIRLTKSSEISEPTFTVNNENALLFNANEYIGYLQDRLSGRRDFYKSLDGKAIYALVTWRDGNTTWHNIVGIAPTDIFSGTFSWNGNSTSTLGPIQHDGHDWSYTVGFGFQDPYFTSGDIVTNAIYDLSTLSPQESIEYILNDLSAAYIAGVQTNIKEALYEYLIYVSEPKSDITPTDIPSAEEPTNPPQPDNPDPYYDPTSDPQSPQYEPTKDPHSPDYDPSTPATPYRPPSTSGGGNPSVQTEIPSVIPAPETPASYVTTNSMFTLYNPSRGDLDNLANFLWSNTWSVDTFKKIFANPLDCILGLMVMPYLDADVSTKTMNVGNISTGVSMHYFTKQFYDFDCGDIVINEYYASYLDYSPYTKINIYLPFIGDRQLNIDEVMNKTINVKYRFDLASGDCIAFISVNDSVLYSYSGNCAARIPLSANNWGGLMPSLLSGITAVGSAAAGIPALGTAAALAVATMKENISHTGNIQGSAGLMGIQTPYIIINRPRQAFPLNQNKFTGYPSFMTESLYSLNGYTEIEACNLSNIPATGDELIEIDRLLKGGVLL